VRILLGSSDHTVDSAAPGASSTPGASSSTPSQGPSAGQRTAAQDACH
jgi:hypothetical protein